MSVVIETTLGDLTVDLFTEERPIACLNFLKLCKLKYFNFNLFHTIEQGFIAQTGDPTGVGDGGCSIWGLVEGIHKRFFEAEYLPKIYHSSAGLLSLVSAGKGLVGSQLFFTLGENLSSLDGIHCVIGEVVEGHETLRKLNEAIVDEKFRPYQDIRITHTVILEDPFPDPRGFQVPSRSPSPTAERLQNGRIAADEDIDDTDGKTLEEVQEMLAEREAKARATILEIVGDLPDANVAPPENVLFVCKLNPVTTDDDLEIIFSRFGKVKCCEVIRDKQSGDSLQYAFVEFEEQKSCEAAYFKMDNVLIDDRRIHVDFSQSVARVKWRGKGRGVDGQAGRLDFNNLRSKPDYKDRRGGERHENGSRNKADDRPRMTSEERRKAREERHREQEKRDKDRSRSRSRERQSNYRNTDRRTDYQQNRRYRNSPPRNGRYNYEDKHRYNESRYQKTTENTNRNGSNRRRSEERHLSRSVEWQKDERSRKPYESNQRKRSRSAEAQTNKSKEAEKRYRDRDESNSKKDRRRSKSNEKQDRIVEHGINRSLRRDISEQTYHRNSALEPIRKKQKQSKKSKKETDKRKKSKTSRRSTSDTESSSESESEDEDSSESSSSESSSTDSSSAEERHRKKKSKAKKKKTVKNKKKSKKQRK